MNFKTQTYRGEPVLTWGETPGEYAAPPTLSKHEARCASFTKTREAREPSPLWSASVKALTLAEGARDGRYPGEGAPGPRADSFEIHRGFIAPIQDCE